MSTQSDRIEALADAIARLRPDRNSLVATLKGFANTVLNDRDEKRLEDQSAAQEQLDELIKAWTGK